jgi:hypothetical protein
MIDILAGVPGRLKALMDRLSSTWAAKVDTLHDTRLTSTRAGYLDNLSAGAPALASNYTATRAGYLDLLPSIGTTVVNSIQTGFATIPNTQSYVDVTISAVNTNKAIVLHGGHIAAQLIDGTASLALVNSTTIRAQRGGTQENLSVRYTVLEFK